MKLSTKGRYAMVALADLAMQDDGALLSLTDLAKRQDISLPYLEQLFVKLRRAGWWIVSVDRVEDINWRAQHRKFACRKCWKPWMKPYQRCTKARARLVRPRARARNP